MGWLDRHVEKRARKMIQEARSITDIPGYWPLDEGVGGSAVASVSRALSLVPVFGAIRLLADSIASLTPVLYTVDSDGILVRQPTPSLFAQPSIHGTLYDWLFRAVNSMALQGDAIGLITNYDYYGWPTMIEWLNPEQVATNDGKLYGPGSYMDPMWWWWGRPIDPRGLLHIPWFAMPYRVRGLSPIGAYQLAMNVGIGAEEFAANWFGQGGVPPGTFKNKNKVIDDKEAQALTARLTAKLQARKPLVYGADWDYTPIAIKPHEAEFVTTMQLTATHIATIYGVPARRIGGLSGGSMDYSSTEMDTIDFLTFSARPWLRRFEQAFTRCFPRNYFVKFETQDMLLLDAKTRAEVDALSIGFQNPMGWKNTDEVRATYDMSPRKAIPILPQFGINLPPGSKPDPVPAPKLVNGDGAPISNGNGNGTNGNGVNPGGVPHADISNTNNHLSGARALEETMRHRPKSGRQALLEVMAAKEPGSLVAKPEPLSWPPKYERAVIDDTPGIEYRQPEFMRDRV
jgi:HK97 family phage portal protein